MFQLIRLFPRRGYRFGCFRAVDAQRRQRHYRILRHAVRSRRFRDDAHPFLRAVYVRFDLFAQFQNDAFRGLFADALDFGKRAHVAADDADRKRAQIHARKNLHRDFGTDPADRDQLLEHRLFFFAVKSEQPHRILLYLQIRVHGRFLALLAQFGQRIIGYVNIVSNPAALDDELSFPIINDFTADRIIHGYSIVFLRANVNCLGGYRIDISHVERYNKNMIADIFTMLIDLLNCPKMTARELAQKLEISERTVYRYVDVLSYAHIPVVCKKGRGGGIMIGEDFKLHAQYLDAEELQLLQSALDTLPLKQSAAKLKSKLVSMSKTPRGGQAYGNECFAVDKSNWGNHEKMQNKMEILTRAVTQRKLLRITYHDRAGNRSDRTIEPYVLVYGDGMWYVYAWCTMRRQMRMFRLSRITHILPSDKTFVPREYDTTWDLKSPLVHEDISVVLRVGERARYDVEEWLGVEAVRKSDRDGWIAQGLVADNDATLNKILSLRDDCEVLSPPQLRQKIQRVCKSICSVYRTDSDRN